MVCEHYGELGHLLLAAARLLLLVTVVLTR